MSGDELRCPVLGCVDSVMSGDEASVSEDAAVMNCMDQQCATMFSDELQWSYMSGDSSNAPRSC